MVARAFTVAFEGVEARMVEVQCAVAPGMPHFGIVGLPDKAVSEARERVRAALSAMSIALPSRRITVNLAPADLPKEGAHFDLPIALALLAACSSEKPAEDKLVTLDGPGGTASDTTVAGDVPAAAQTGVQAVDAEGAKLEPLLSSAISAAGPGTTFDGCAPFGPLILIFFATLGTSWAGYFL